MLKFKTKWTSTELLHVQIGIYIGKMGGALKRKFHRFNEFYLVPEEVKDLHKKLDQQKWKLAKKKFNGIIK
jgi:hypothetical protein